MGCCKCESQAQVCQGGETERHKHRNLTEEKDLLKRLNRIEGQVRGVKAMVEDERYCVDILNRGDHRVAPPDGWKKMEFILPDL